MSPADSRVPPRSDGFRRRRRLLAWLIVAAAVMILVLGWLLPDIGDDGRVVRVVNWVSFAIRTFTPHGGLVLLLLTLPVALARVWRPAAALTVLSLLCILPLLGLGSRSGMPSQGGSSSIEVMTVNVMYGRVRDADLLAEIDRLQPDVLVIQEYTTAFHARIRSSLQARLPHSSIAPRDDAFGMAIFSKLPFAEAPVNYPSLSVGATTFQPTEPQIRAIIKVSEREVVVQGVHTLPPIRPAYLMEQRRLCRGLAAFALSERRPLVLAGDFNHTPTSMPAGWLWSAGLNDAHTLAGTGRGLTWPAEDGLLSFSGFRLDQVLVSQGLIVSRCRVGNDIGSDHRPVIARIGLP